ncbi:hypothetical protein FE391_40125 [Nonomuraea sp. KC401]|uniref:hypothetical protein n=1 Tax=unclassified Nonomuraea TaxID=2593643 RepID=UPI0010FD66D7|nr:MULTISPECIES: hypothetical protein [unclassified Nonomuraea]NBE99759.1 hypothetical protein [Nonomuraea sp. K271]TLF55837.1 hypothetical protein FE391_40125 [Nonomuraea sp. KC401]
MICSRCQATYAASDQNARSLALPTLEIQRSSSAGSSRVRRVLATKQAEVSQAIADPASSPNEMPSRARGAPSAVSHGESWRAQTAATQTSRTAVIRCPFAPGA